MIAKACVPDENRQPSGASRRWPNGNSSWAGGIAVQRFSIMFEGLRPFRASCRTKWILCGGPHCMLVPWLLAPGVTFKLYVLLVLIVSPVCFALYGIDKRRVGRQRPRISERTLHVAAFVGGWPGLAGPACLPSQDREILVSPGVLADCRTPFEFHFPGSLRAGDPLMRPAGNHGRGPTETARAIVEEIRTTGHQRTVRISSCFRHSVMRHSSSPTMTGHSAVSISTLSNTGLFCFSQASAADFSAADILLI